jgi:hypothetical protein
MIYSGSSFAGKTELIKITLEKAETLITGAGMDYEDTAGFNALFNGCHDRYGLKTINKTDFYQFPPRGNKNFIEKPRVEKHQMLNDFLDVNRNKKILFLEPCMSFNTPGIIRVNPDIVEISLIHKSDRAAIIQGGPGTILNKLAEDYL